jgi:hypothetical protein
MAAAGGIVAVLSECAAPQRGEAVPMDRTTQASVLGVPNERFFPLYGTEPLLSATAGLLLNGQPRSAARWALLDGPSPP